MMFYVFYDKNDFVRFCGTARDLVRRGFFKSVRGVKDTAMKTNKKYPNRVIKIPLPDEYIYNDQLFIDDIELSLNCNLYVPPEDLKKYKEVKQMSSVRIKLNPDKEHVAEMRKAIKENDGYCPCATNKNDDTKCMCLEFRTTGICHCGLYVCERGT